MVNGFKNNLIYLLFEFDLFEIATSYIYLE